MDAVSRAYRDARDAHGSADLLPSPALDDAIRAAARRAVRSGPQPLGGKWLRQWTPQLAAAAVVILSVSVIFVSVQERPDLAPGPIMTFKPAAKAPAERAADSRSIMEAKVAEEMAPSAQRAKVQEQAKAQKNKQVSGATGNSVDARTSQSAPAAYAKEERSAAMVPPPEIQMKPSIIGQPARVAPPAYAPPAPPAQSPPPAPAAAATAPAANAVPFPGSSADAGASLRREARADAQPAPVADSKLLEKKVAAPESVRANDVLEQTTRARAPTPAPVTAQAMPASPARAQALADKSQARDAYAGASVSGTLAAQASKSAAGGNAVEPPGPWLKRLLELREQGKLKELREELVRFRKAHPDVVLPKSLSELPAE